MNKEDFATIITIITNFIIILSIPFLLFVMDPPKNKPFNDKCDLVHEVIIEK